MHLNPQKCSFGVTLEMFLRYIVDTCRIEAKPEKIQPLKNIKEKKQDVMILTRRVATTTRFISGMIDKCVSFFDLSTREAKFNG